MTPLLFLLASFAVFFLVNRWFLNKQFSISFMGRTAMAFMLVMTGIAHFIQTRAMVAMLPDFMPFKEVVVYLTGIMEIAAAIGLLTSKYSRRASILLILFFICILPANILGSMKSVALGGMEYGPAYLFFRIPLQLLFIAWTYYFGIRINNNLSG